jgi:hypothetical protein
VRSQIEAEVAEAAAAAERAARAEVWATELQQRANLREDIL